MDKKAIEYFAVGARKKLIDSCRDKAAWLGIYADRFDNPEILPNGIHKFTQKAGHYFTISGIEIEWRESLIRRVNEVGYNQVMEETAYSWFNQLIAIRFMEVNGYLPVRVLSSKTKGKIEPDIVTEAPEIDFGVKGKISFSPDERKFVSDCQMQNKTDDLFKLLLVKQSDALQILLPGFVKKTEDYMKLLLNISFSNPDGVVRRLVSDISEDDFKEAVEIIGWLYQYYNSELKDETFAALKKNVKITKVTLPAATQLFTPDWIVRYMVENSLGRLWLDAHPNDFSLKENWKYYLEEAKQEPAVAAELAKIRAESAKLTPEDITFIDPCMGSGHILVYAFDVLMDIYRMAGYQERDAARLIVEKNLYGLDVDDRAGQLSYFAVLMKARKYDRRILSEGVSTHLFSIAESNIIPDELVSHIAGKDALLQKDIEYLIKTFYDAKEYGSILEVKELDFTKLRSRVDDLLHRSQQTFYSFNDELLRLRHIINQAEILAKKYDVVVTNPPYMGSSGMNPKLSDFVKKNYPNSKSDLSTVCMEKTLTLCKNNGFMSMINIPVWMFLSSYKKLRQNIISKNTIVNMVHPGRGIFGSDFGTTSFVIARNHISNYIGHYRRLFQKHGEVETNEEREKHFHEGVGKYYVTQDNLTKIPGSPIAYWVSKNMMTCFTQYDKLASVSLPLTGTSTGNNDVFMKLWHEVSIVKINFKQVNSHDTKNKWFPCNKGGEYRKWYGNNYYIIDWENNGYGIRHNYDDSGKLRSRPLNIEYMFLQGITWGKMGVGNDSYRYFPDGFICESIGCEIIEKEDNYNLYSILGLVNSKVSGLFINTINPTFGRQPGYLGSIPYNVPEEKKELIETTVKNSIVICKIDWDSFETSWDFAKHPFLAHKGVAIKDSFENWQSFAEMQFDQLKANEEELNRIFIDIYGLRDELTPDVEDKDVTVRKADLARDIKSFISYAVGCMFGRYSLDKEGLIFAGGEWNSENYKTYPADEDGIIPITDNEYFPDDITGRFVSFLKTSFGTEHLEKNLDFIAKALGNKGSTSRKIIRNYFQTDFYKDHLKIYQKKPIYWLFDSGKENGFKALIYLHRYNPDTVGKVRIDYLHKLQKKYEDAIERTKYITENGTPAEQKKSNAENIKLIKQLAETRSYDMALGHIASQRISIDLDEGVTVNYAKFQKVLLKQEGLSEKRISLLGEIK